MQPIDEMTILALETSCDETSAGCPYDLLKVATGEAPPSVGADPLPEDAYISSNSEAEYCGSGTATGTFGLSTGCWTGRQPAIKFKAH